MNTKIAEPTVQGPWTDPYEMLITEARVLQQRLRRRWLAVLALIALTTVVTVVAGGSGRHPSKSVAPNSSPSSRSSTTASASTKPATIRGHVLSYAETNAVGYDGDIAYGTPMKFPTMSVGVPNPDPVSCIGQRCFALGYNSFQFPAISSDHGRTWRNGGHWFAGAWADGAAFATRITLFSGSLAVAWFPMHGTGFYSTATAGRRWYSVVWPGDVTGVTGSRISDVVTVTLVSFNSPRTYKSFRYSSRDGGLVWTLDQ